MLQKSLSGSSCGLPNEAHCTTCYCLLSGLDLLWSLGISLGLIDTISRHSENLFLSARRDCHHPEGFLNGGFLWIKNSDSTADHCAIFPHHAQEKSRAHKMRMSSPIYSTSEGKARENFPALFLCPQPITLKEMKDFSLSFILI